MFYGQAEAQPMSRPEIDRARRVCEACPVRGICLIDALDNDEGWGVWGGYTRPERARAQSILGCNENIAIAFDGGVIVIEGSAPIVTVGFEEHGLDYLVRLS